MPAQKSAPLAFILTIVFGPLGYLYVSVFWGVVWLLIYGVLFVVTLGIAGVLAPVMNVLLSIWAIFSVQRQNAAMASVSRRSDSPLL